MHAGVGLLVQRCGAVVKRTIHVITNASTLEWPSTAAASMDFVWNPTVETAEVRV